MDAFVFELLAEQICNGVAKKCGKRYPLKTVCGIVCKICRYLEEENKIKIDFMYLCRTKIKTLKILFPWVSRSVHLT